MRLPEVTVVMPVYNAGPYLTEAVESVLAQRGAPSWELLVVDDASTDDSAERARACAAREPTRIRVLRFADGSNRGSSAARNLALQHARGSVLALLDADDVWLPDAMAIQHGTLSRQADVAMVFAAAERWYSHATPGAEDVVPPLRAYGASAGRFEPGELVSWFWGDESLAPCTCTVFARKSVVCEVGGFEAEFPGLYDDQVLYVKLADQYPVYYTQECLARYRQHAASCCRTSGALQVAARTQFEAWVSGYRTRKRSANATPHSEPSLDAKPSSVSATRPPN